MTGSSSEDVVDTSAQGGTKVTITSARDTVLRLIRPYDVQLVVMFDPDDPDQQDDAAVLESSDGAYSCRVSIAAGEDVPEGGKRLTFTGVLPDKEYSLMIDPGPSGEKYYVFRTVPADRAFLRQLRAGS